MEDKFESCNSLNNTSKQLFKSVFFCTILRFLKYLQHRTERINLGLKQARIGWLNIVGGYGVR
jgi:hypothetical protein